MPYDTNAQLPAYVRSLSSKRQRQWRHVWNSAYQSCMNGQEKDSGKCESKAFAQASGVVKNTGAEEKKGTASHSMSKKNRSPLVLDAQTLLSDEEIAFKTLTSEDRDKLPVNAYAYIDPTGGKHLPITDRAHLENAITRLGQEKALKEFLSKEDRVALQAKLQAKLETVNNTYSKAVADNLVAFAFGPDSSDESLVKAETDSAVVLRRGKIFAAGDYPDKDFSLTPKELRKIVKDFEGPVELDSEHERSIFDGKLGRLVGIESAENGQELHGIVEIPKWLDPILMEAGGKVSAAFDRITKKLVGLALTINPRVPDAALMAAFSIGQVANGNVSVEELVAMAANDDKKAAKKKAKLESTLAKVKNDGDNDDEGESKVTNTATKPNGAKPNKKNKFVGYDKLIPQSDYLAKNSANSADSNDDTQPKDDIVNMALTMSGRSMMQTIHDVTASRGAVCREEPQPATKIGPYGIVRYASQDEMGVIQGIHDTCLQHGASCTPTLYGQRDEPGGAPWTWEYPGLTGDGRKSVPGLDKSHFADESEDTQGSNKSMKAAKNFARFMQSLDEVDPRYVKTPPAAKTDSDDAARASNDQEADFIIGENARLREENRKMRMQGILDRAVAFADKVIMEGHATPVEREGIITVHAQLEHDDTFSAQATFSNGMSRVAAYEASLLARPNNLLQAELLPAAVQSGLIKFANMTTGTTIKASDGGGKMTDERKAYLTGLDPVLKKAHSDIQKNGSK